MYSWTLLTHKPGDSPYVSGITDDLANARRVAEPCLKSRAAFLCCIEEVRYAMTVTDLSPCYAPTGRYWAGRLDVRGRVRWTEHRGTAAETRWQEFKEASAVPGIAAETPRV